MIVVPGFDPAAQGQHTIVCALCRATYRIANDLLDLRQAQFFASLNGWTCRFEANLHWCAACTRANAPRPVPTVPTPPRRRKPRL